MTAKRPCDRCVTKFELRNMSLMTAKTMGALEEWHSERECISRVVMHINRLDALYDRLGERLERLDYP